MPWLYCTVFDSVYIPGDVNTLTVLHWLWLCLYPCRWRWCKCVDCTAVFLTAFISLLMLVCKHCFWLHNHFYLCRCWLCKHVDRIALFLTAFINIPADADPCWCCKHVDLKSLHFANRWVEGESIPGMLTSGISSTCQSSSGHTWTNAWPTNVPFMSSGWELRFLRYNLCHI